MTDEIDDMFADESEDAREDARRVLRGRGMRAAVRAAIEICESKDAPAPAKATAAGWIFRANGMLGNSSDETEKEPHEMSPAELGRALARAKAKAEAFEQREPDRPSRTKKKGAGIFG